MWIKETVERLINEYSTNNPFEIANAKNIYVVERNLHDDIMGFYKYIRRNKFIYINSNLDLKNKFYTCAHELGHSEFHTRLNTPFLKRRTLLSFNKIEKEANRFAVELLLPDSNLEEYRHTQLSLEEIAGIHGVPREVARLKKI